MSHDLHNIFDTFNTMMKQFTFELNDITNSEQLIQILEQHYANIVQINQPLTGGSYKNKYIKYYIINNITH